MLFITGRTHDYKTVFWNSDATSDNLKPNLKLELCYGHFFCYKLLSLFEVMLLRCSSYGILWLKEKLNLENKEKTKKESKLLTDHLGVICHFNVTTM